MGCLDNLIGLDGSCTSITGRVYLKDVGIQESELAQYLSEEEEGVEALVQSVGRAAAAQLTSDILGDMVAQQRIKAHTFVDRARIGYYHEEREVITPAASTLAGLVLDVYAPKSNIKLGITQLSVWPTANGTVTVSMYDMTDGTLIGTETITGCVANEIKRKDVDISIQARRHRMRVLCLTNMPTWNRVDIAEGCATCPGSREWQYSVMGAYGATIDNSAAKMYANVQRVTETGGLSVIASVDCDHGAFLCEQKEALAWPLMLLQASMFMQRALANVDRIGTRQLNRDVLQDRLGQYVAQYNDARSVLIKGMYVPDDQFCYLCKASARVNVMIP